jgi:thiol-disulfide isomerase/thioredoxin
LTKQLSERCNIKPLSIIYFYSNKESCPDCEKQAHVLNYLRDTYPQLRVYAFDYDLDLSAVETLTTINKVKREFPALVLPKGLVLYGFNSIENLEIHIPAVPITSTSTKNTL